MTNKEILNQEFERFNCANMLSTDGLMYKAIISAMDRVRQVSPNGLENGFSVATFLSAEKQSETLNEIDNFLGTGYSEAEVAEYDKRQEAAMKELNMPERHKQFLAAAEKVRNDITCYTVTDSKVIIKWATERTVILKEYVMLFKVDIKLLTEFDSGTVKLLRLSFK